MEANDMNQTMPEVEEPKPKSFFSRLGGVYTSPRAAFREIGQAPRVLLPLICLVVVSLLAGIYLSRRLDLESAAVAQLETLVQRGTITKAQMEQQLLLTSKIAGIQLIVGAPLGSILVALAIAGFAKLFSLFVTAENRFKPLLTVTIYTTLAVSIVQYALIILILQMKGPGEVDLSQIKSVIASNLGAILSSFWGNDVLPKFLMGLASGVDVFAIWMIALLSIGYSMVSRKLKTSTAAVWLVAAYIVVIVIGAAASSIFNIPS